MKIYVMCVLDSQSSYTADDDDEDDYDEIQLHSCSESRNYQQAGVK